jgi:hypothetical protein
MTPWIRASSSTLAVVLATAACVTPAMAQLDRGIAPKADSKLPRPSSPGQVLLGNPAAPTQTAEATGIRNPVPGAPNGQQLKAAVPPGYKLKPELESLLSQWEKQTQGVQRLSGNYRLYTYDQVFQTETRAEGQFWYQSPDKGRMDFKPADLSRIERDPKTGKAINSSKKGADGVPYEVKAKEAEVWNCNGSEILQLFPGRKEYNRVAIPPQFQGESIKESPLPFLFGLRKAEAMDRYLMDLGPLHGKSIRNIKGPVIHVIALPLREQDSREWSKAEVLLDSQTFLPQSIRTFDPAGTSENVYAFSDIEVNGRWLFSNPFNPSVSGYQLIHDRSTEPQQPSSVPNVPAPRMPVKGALK